MGRVGPRFWLIRLFSRRDAGAAVHSPLALNLANGRLSDGTERVTNIVPEITEYLTADGFSPFGAWFRALDATPRARVATALQRLASGNAGDCHGVGRGVLEVRLHTGPGYRIYYGQDGRSRSVLLAGGTKRRQWQDILMAQDRWQDFKRRKRTEK